MSKLVKFEIANETENIPCYVNPELVTCVCANLVNGGTIIYFDDNNLINVIGDVGEIAAKLNVDTEKVEHPEQLNVNNVLIYNGKIYQAVKDKICSACAFYEKGKACDDNRGRCTDQQIHFRKVTQHE